jgi:hypothetical protein
MYDGRGPATVVPLGKRPLPCHCASDLTASARWTT